MVRIEEGGAEKELPAVYRGWSEELYRIVKWRESEKENLQSIKWYPLANS